MFRLTAGSRFRSPKGVRMGRHVDAKPRLTVVGSALSLAVDASLRLGSVSRFPWARRATLAAFLTAAVLSLVVAAPISPQR
jgi:putative NADH-flavin reductase